MTRIITPLNTKGRNKEYIPSRKSPAYDPQREEVYHMENRGLNGLQSCLWSRKDCTFAIRELSTYFKVPTPSVSFMDLGEYAGDYHKGKIRLSTTRGGRSPLVCLHELTHHIVDVWDEESVLAPHGPEWAGVYGDVLAVAGVVPYEGFRSLSRQYGVYLVDTAKLTTVEELRASVFKRIYLLK